MAKHDKHAGQPAQAPKNAPVTPLLEDEVVKGLAESAAAHAEKLMAEVVQTNPVPMKILRVRKAKPGKFYRCGMKFEHTKWQEFAMDKLPAETVERLLNEPMLQTQIVTE